MDKMQKTDQDYQKELSPELYKIAREKGTETPFTGKYNFSKEDGVYKCAVCDNPLFKSDTKFDSGTGWPSFDKPISENAVEYETDTSGGMTRTEVKCARCGSHLGHMFEDGPTETGKRYCLNSVCLNLLPEKK
ncbi:MAG TPA: peptide-methionine (R)-S-oxide reductase MsrB [Candidatus Saccharimonadales bacterium]|nr:peptide-methionine (R)-S-oxide reductase MsrB [Candidatus Saccharimonadales bacterium]